MEGGKDVDGGIFILYSLVFVARTGMRSLVDAVGLGCLSHLIDL